MQRPTCWAGRRRRRGRVARTGAGNRRSEARPGRSANLGTRRRGRDASTSPPTQGRQDRPVVQARRRPLSRRARDEGSLRQEGHRASCRSTCSSPTTRSSRSRSRTCSPRRSGRWSRARNSWRCGAPATTRAGRSSRSSIAARCMQSFWTDAGEDAGQASSRRSTKACAAASPCASRMVRENRAYLEIAPRRRAVDATRT